MLAAEYFSTTYETIKRNYLHLHPDYQEDCDVRRQSAWEAPGTKWNETNQKER